MATNIPTDSVNHPEITVRSDVLDELRKVCDRDSCTCAVQGAIREIVQLRKALSMQTADALATVTDLQTEVARLRAENEALRLGFFQLVNFAAQQRASVEQRIAPDVNPESR